MVAPESTTKKKVATRRRRRNSLRTTKASYTLASYYLCKLIFLQSAKPLGARHHVSYLSLGEPIPSFYFTSFYLFSK
jgi:hypothetical protein